MTAKTIFLLEQPLEFSPIFGFVFSATLFIYAGHRVIGINKAKAFKDKGRYKIISEYRYHIILYAILGGMGTLVFACFLSKPTIGIMLIPGLISVAYIIPFFAGKEKKRLRDFNYVKIFFVAIIWMWVSVLLPYFELQEKNILFLVLTGIEVFLFVFAITIPFDIRDVKEDGYNQVKTIPSTYGIEGAKKIAYILLSLSFIAGCINIFFLEIKTLSYYKLFISYIFTYVVVLYLIIQSNTDKEDHYYTFYLDGTMVLLPLFIIGIHSF